MQSIIDAAQSELTSSGYAGVGVEATISRVVTLENVNLYSAPPAPMWQVLTGFAWDSGNAQFTVEYEALAGTAANGLDDYKRVLYFSKESSYAMATGDGGNICLSNSGNSPAAIEECRAELTSNYVSFLPDTLGSELTIDYTSDSEDGGAGDLVPGIEVVVTPIADTEKEKISIKLSLDAVLGTVAGDPQLGRPDPSLPAAQYYDVGIGMLFWPSAGSKTVMFDEYRLVVDSANTFQVEKLNRYTLAEHVNYQIVQKDRDGTTPLRAARIEFLLAADNVLHQSAADSGISMRVKMPSLYCTTQGLTEPCFLHTNAAMCTTLGVEIASISSPTCFTPHEAICEPQIADITTGSETRQLISATFPIPDAFEAPTPFNIEIHLSVQTNAVGAAAGSTPLLSLLNFESNVEPQLVCTDPTIQDYKPIDFVVGEIFGKTDGDNMVRLRQCTGSAHCAANALYNDLGGTLTTQSMIQALAMLVVRPQYTAVARAYFDGQAHEARLDDMYIIHQVPESDTTVTDISTHTGAVASATNADGRAVLDIPTDLTGGTPCILEAASPPITNTDTCVTTHDYDASGPLTRPQTLGQKVYEIQYDGSVFLDPTFDNGSPGIILSSNPCEVSSAIPVAIFITSILTDGFDTLSLGTDAGADVTITSIGMYGETIFDKAYKEYKLEFVEGATIPATVILTISYSDGTTTYSTTATLNIDTGDVNAAVAADQASLGAIYGSGTLEAAAMVAFQYDSARLTPDARDAGRYWVWPVYDWQASVLGLVDTSTLIMAWSVGQPVAAPVAAPASGGGRRLLELEPPARAVDVKNSKSIQIHRAQEQTPALPANKIFSATKLADLGRACALLPDSRKLAAPPWRDVVLRALNCTAPESSVSFDSALSPHPACAGVIACEKTEASPRGCADAVADAARAMHVLQDWETPLTSQRNDSNHTVRYQESHAGFDVNDVGAGPAAATLVSTDACDAAARYAAAARPPAVLDVVYDATVPPPMQAVVMAPNGSTACSLEALVQRLSPMRLLAVRPTRALFVSPTLAAAVKLHDVDTQSAFATTHTGTASSLHHQASYATLPRAVMAHLLEKHITEPGRVILTCGGTALHEQIGMGKRRSMPKIRQTGL